MVHDKRITGLPDDDTALLMARAMSGESWLLIRLFGAIRHHHHDLDVLKDRPVQFGAQKSKPFSDVVFDFRVARDAYRLSHKIVAQGMRTADNEWSGLFQTPRLIVLPKPIAHDRKTICAEFRGCAANGDKGARYITPYVHNVSSTLFKTMHAQGDQVIALSECRLRKTGDQSFDLHIVLSDCGHNRMPLHGRRM